MSLPSGLAAFRNALVPSTLLALAVLGGTAHADPTRTMSVYGQLGKSGSDSDTDAYTLGITAPIGWQGSVFGAPVGAYWDLYGSYLRAAAGNGGGHINTSLIGLTPTFRLRFDGGRSAWFTDAGVGISYTGDKYRSNAKAFSTRFNFGSHLALGYSFGNQFSQEVSLRIQHYSNASIKKPNPGENYVQLRYAYGF